MMLNQHELRALVKKHCGEKMDKGEKICQSCAKKLSRAKKIDKQVEQMWRKHAMGFFNRPWARKERGYEGRKEETQNRYGRRGEGNPGPKREHQTQTQRER